MQGGWRRMLNPETLGQFVEGTSVFTAMRTTQPEQLSQCSCAGPSPLRKQVPTAQVPTAAQDQLWRTPSENHLSSERKKSKCQLRMTPEGTAEAQLHVQAITKSPRLIKYFFLSQLLLPCLFSLPTSHF